MLRGSVLQLADKLLGDRNANELIGKWHEAILYRNPAMRESTENEPKNQWEPPKQAAPIGSIWGSQPEWVSSVRGFGS